MTFEWMDNHTLFMLHLSDFHQGKDEHGQEVLYGKLLEEIITATAEAKRGPDLVFITGDIADKGTEYKPFVTQFLEPLGKFLPDTVLFTVPGNHDVNRKKAKPAHRYDLLDVCPNFFDPKAEGQEERETLFPRFQAYIDALKPFTPCEWIKSEAGTYADVLTVRGLKVGLLLLNTAWLSGSDQEDGKLRLTVDMVRHGLKQLADAQLILVLGHHPLASLHLDDQKKIESLFGKNHVLYLHGHTHRSAGSRREGAGEDFLNLGAGAGFAGREDPIWKNGFQWYGLDPSQARLLVHPQHWNADNQEWVTATHVFPKIRKAKIADWWQFEIPAVTQPLTQPEISATAPGLRPVERAYLELNLPNWTVGRSRGGGGFQGFEEIYEQGSYVPLDGLCHLFAYDDKTGNLTPHGREQSDMARLKENSLRRPLGWWASRRELPWMVLSGSPGAGKTVFLTRFAANLAHELLGRETMGEAHVDASAMANGGRLPIPLTLEAHTLAEKPKRDYADLVAAVQAELSCTKYMAPKPTEQEVAADLAGGRYLLLIDALDEVPESGSRRALLRWLKGLAVPLAGTRILLTTRSARYTGDMAFGPEFKPVELTDLNQAQIELICTRFCHVKGKGREFRERLLQAIHGVDQRTRGGDEDTNLVGNPLLLQTACSVFFKRNHLPENRASLCSEVVEHLCRAKDSAWKDKNVCDREDWTLSPGQKRDLLERIGLNMQKEKAQEWPLARVYAVVEETLPEQQRSPARLEQYVKWLVAHTGLIYYSGGEKDETLRFHHRLFREYLAACCIKNEDKTLKDQLHDLYEAGRLTDPFWLDVVRLLPGAIGGEAKAVTFGEEMLALAEEDGPKRGRLLATLCAAVVENRDLFHRFDQQRLIQESVAAYEAEGKHWDVATNRLLLAQLGWLGDPRPDFSAVGYWQVFQPATFIMGEKSNKETEHHKEIVVPFWMGRYQVTNAQFEGFVRDEGYDRKEAFWSEKGWQWRCENQEKWKGRTSKLQPKNPFSQPNQPVVDVCWYEAEAFCAWLEEKINQEKPHWLDGAEVEVGLPTEAEWAFAARGEKGCPFPWAEGELNKTKANFGNQIGHTTPVGTYHAGATPEGVFDMAGNVWEWCQDVFAEAAYKTRKRLGGNPLNIEGDPTGRVLRGGSWIDDADYLRASCRLWFRAWFRDYDVGFRCVLRRRSPEYG